MSRVLAAGAYFPFDADLIDRSAAWKNDVGVDVSTIRKFGGKFGRGVAVEAGVTGLYTLSNFTTLLGNYNATDGFSASGVTDQSDGWRRVPKMGATLAATEIFVNVAPGTTAGTRYTFRCLFRYDGTRPTFTMRFINSPGAQGGAIAPTLIDLGGGVWSAAITDVVTSTSTSTRVVLNQIAWGTGTYLELQEWMFFAHAGTLAAVTEPVYSSQVYGTRAAGVLKYPGALLPRTAGTVSGWIRPNYDYLNFPSADNRGIVTSTTTNASDQMQFWISGTAKLNWQAWQGGILRAEIEYLPAGWSATKWHHVACTWSDTEQVLYYDGARVATRSGAFTRWTQATWVTFGTASSPAAANDWLEGLLDDVAILSRQLTDAQIAAIFKLGAPFTGEAGLAAAGLI